MANNFISSEVMIKLYNQVWVQARNDERMQSCSLYFKVNFYVQVYFPSRYRGLCVGTLVSRVTVITAAVCVTSPNANVKDTRPINVVTGATYRHPRRGIRVQVTKILVPNRKFQLHQITRFRPRPHYGVIAAVLTA